MKIAWFWIKSAGSEEKWQRNNTTLNEKERRITTKSFDFEWSQLEAEKRGNEQTILNQKEWRKISNCLILNQARWRRRENSANEKNNFKRKRTTEHLYVFDFDSIQLEAEKSGNEQNYFKRKITTNPWTLLDFELRQLEAENSGTETNYFKRKRTTNHCGGGEKWKLKHQL